MGGARIRPECMARVLLAAFHSQIGASGATKRYRAVTIIEGSGACLIYSSVHKSYKNRLWEMPAVLAKSAQFLASRQGSSCSSAARSRYTARYPAASAGLACPPATPRDPGLLCVGVCS